MYPPRVESCAFSCFGSAFSSVQIFLFGPRSRAAIAYFLCSLPDAEVVRLRPISKKTGFFGVSVFGYNAVKSTACFRVLLYANWTNWACIFCGAAFV